MRRMWEVYQSKKLFIVKTKRRLKIKENSLFLTVIIKVGTNLFPQKFDQVLVAYERFKK